MYCQPSICGGIAAAPAASALVSSVHYAATAITAGAVYQSCNRVASLYTYYFTQPSNNIPIGQYSFVISAVDTTKAVFGVAADQQAGPPVVPVSGGVMLPLTPAVAQTNYVIPNL
jgi:hypothetical protein